MGFLTYLEKGRGIYVKKERNCFSDNYFERGEIDTAFLREDYPYKAIDEKVEDFNRLESNAVYEIKCFNCEMSIRSQGVNIKGTMESLKKTGCIGCGNKDLIVRQVDMSSASIN